MKKIYKLSPLQALLEAKMEGKNQSQTANALFNDFISIKNALYPHSLLSRAMFFILCLLLSTYTYAQLEINYKVETNNFRLSGCGSEAGNEEPTWFVWCR